MTGHLIGRVRPGPGRICPGAFRRRRCKASGRRADSRCRSRTAPARQRRSRLQAATDALDRRGAQGSRGSRALFTTFRAERAAVVRQRRSRQGQEGKRRRHRCLPGPAGLPRQLLHQRFQLPRPDVQGDRPGRRPVSRHGLRHRPVEDPQRRRRDGAAGDGHGPEEDRRRRPHQPLQLSILPPKSTAPAARASAAGRPSRSWRTWPRKSFRPASATNGPNWRTRRRRPATRRC